MLAPCGTGVRSFKRDDGEDEAEEQRTGVAHEDPRRVPVVEQEGEAGGGDHDRHATHEPLTLEQRGDRERGGDDGGDRAGGGVHVVEQVERVRDDHDPHHGDHVVERAAEELDVRTGGGSGRRRARLHQESHARTHGADVVEEAGHRHQRSGGEDDGRLRLPVRQHGRTGHGAERDGDAAQVRGG